MWPLHSKGLRAVILCARPSLNYCVITVELRSTAEVAGIDYESRMTIGY